MTRKQVDVINGAPGCDHDWEDIGEGRRQCTYPECQKREIVLVATRDSMSSIDDKYDRPK